MKLSPLEQARTIAALAQERCHLAVLSGAEAVYVYKIDGSSNFSMTSRVGGRAPCHATSIGKVLMAWAGPDLLRVVVAAGLPPHTRHTLARAADLEAELERVRSQGYALDMEEYEEGLRCAAAPVRDHAGRVVAAIGIAGPSHRLTDETLPQLIPSVTRAANTISRNLGYVSLERAAVGD